MITVHHLNFSRSTRVLWLLEELGLEYKLVTYERDASFRAPAALKAVHPLGKAPVIEDGELKIAESSAILRHIDSRHGGGRLSPPVGSDAASVHDEWLQYGESSAGFPIMVTVIGAMLGGLPAAVEGFTKPALTNNLDYVAAAVALGPYLMGEQFTLADIQLAYLLELTSAFGALGEHPAINAYLDRLRVRPAFVKAIQVGGPMRPPGR